MWKAHPSAPNPSHFPFFAAAFTAARCVFALGLRQCIQAMRAVESICMDAALKRMVESTGATVPLAAQFLVLILDSGASHIEVTAAMKVVESLLVTLPISYDHEHPAPSQI